MQPRLAIVGFTCAEAAVPHSLVLKVVIHKALLSTTFVLAAFSLFQVQATSAGCSSEGGVSRKDGEQICFMCLDRRDEVS
jgi:hypothetical protein